MKKYCNLRNFLQNFPHQWVYKCVNIHICYSNHVNIHDYCSFANNILFIFFSLPSLEYSTSLLWLSLSLSLSETLSFLSQSFHGRSSLIVTRCSLLPPWFSFIPRLKASPISLIFIQSCSLYLLCTKFSDSWTLTTTTMVIYGNDYHVLLLLSLYLINEFGNLDSLCLTCGFGDLDLVVKFWFCLHVLI